MSFKSKFLGKFLSSHEPAPGAVNTTGVRLLYNPNAKMVDIDLQQFLIRAELFEKSSVDTEKDTSVFSDGLFPTLKDFGNVVSAKSLDVGLLNSTTVTPDGLRPGDILVGVDTYHTVTPAMLELYSKESLPGLGEMLDASKNLVGRLSYMIVLMDVEINSRKQKIVYHLFSVGDDLDLFTGVSEVKACLSFLNFSYRDFTEVKVTDDHTINYFFAVPKKLIPKDILKALDIKIDLRQFIGH